jgi:hypothetical protein|nr:MAG TPA: hypothetical protein [Caudoviricetes sp.]
MTRIILSVGCVGKTYADKNYINVYDFDKHTLEYKYDKTGFEDLSDEEFKGLPNRKINDNWFERYMEDWCKIIDSGKYDVVTGWLQADCLNYLLNRGYNVEIILVDAKNNESIYKKRSQKRGNNEQYWKNMRHSYDKNLDLYRNRNDIKVTIFDKPYYLSDYLIFSGVILKESSRKTYTYVDKIMDKVNSMFNQGDSLLLSQNFLTFYTQLILTALSADLEITKEMVHDSWSVATYYKNNMKFHQSIKPFVCLSKEVQELDQPYVEKLNEVLNYFKDLKKIINL